MVDSIQIDLCLSKSGSKRNILIGTSMRHPLRMRTRGQRIKSERKRMGFTQKRLGEIVGISQQQISYLEGDKSDDTMHLLQISAALGVNPTWLDSEEGPKEAVNWDKIIDIDDLDPVCQSAASALMEGIRSGKITSEQMEGIVKILLAGQGK